jgi:hypothetical protein
LVISGISPVRLPVLSLSLSLVLAGVSPPCAQGVIARSWEDCLKAPDRACVLDEAIDLVNLMDKTDRRQALVAAVAETWAQAGEIDTATQLAMQLPDRLLARIAVLREIAAALARASHDEKAEAVFDQALQLARRENALQRAQMLYSIAQAQAAAGMKAAADTTFYQALQAATTVHIIGEKGRVTLPAPETWLAQLLQHLAVRQAEVGEIGQALQIARSIPYDLKTRARTLLALADQQMRAGLAAEATLDEALAAEHDGRAGLTLWPSFRDTGLGVREESSGNVGVLCDIARAQARAGLTAKAVASFDEALQAAQAITMVDPALQGEVIAGALATVADAQREAGLEAAVHATLDRAATVAEAITYDLNRAQALARLAEVRTKAGGAAQGLFARALLIARALPDDRQRAQALQRIAIAQANAGLRDDGARTFAEAIGLVRLQDGQIVSIADAQRRAGLIEEAAATFEEVLTATISDNDKWKTTRLFSLIHTIVDNGWGKALVAASPTLRIRLVEAAEAITERLGRAEMMSVIARALPS